MKMPNEELISRFPAIPDMNKEMHYKIQVALVRLHRDDYFRMTSAFLDNVKTVPMDCGQSYFIHGTPTALMQSNQFSDLEILLLCCEGYPFNGGTVIHKDNGTLTIFIYL